MAIPLTVFYILSPLSAYNIWTASSIYYQFYYRSLYSCTLNLSSKGCPYLSPSLFIQLGRHTIKYLQKFACLFYLISLTALLYIYNQGFKSYLSYLVSPLIQIYFRLFYYYPCPYFYYYSILLYCFTLSYFCLFYFYYYFTVLLALVFIKRL